MSEENKGVVRDYIEQVLNERKIDLLKQFIAKNVTSQKRLSEPIKQERV